jgi:hypothetical protein
MFDFASRVQIKEDFFLGVSNGEDFIEEISNFYMEKVKKEAVCLAKKNFLAKLRV